MHVPDSMAKLKRWVLWKYITRDGKQTKCPYQPNGSTASSTNPATWNDLATCELALSRYEGLGFVFAADDGLIGVDLDGCRNQDTGEIEPWALAILERFSGTYAEISPSETGVKIFALADHKWSTGNKLDVKQPAKFGKQPQIEVYQKGRFFCFTGERYGDALQVSPSDDSIRWLEHGMATRLGNKVVASAGVTKQTPLLDRARAYVSKMAPAVSGQGGHDATFKVACVLKKGFELSDDDALGILSEYNQSCQPPWTEKELRHKINSAGKQPGATGYLRDATPENWEKIRLPGNYREHKASKGEPAKQELRITTLHDAAEKYLDQLAEGKQSLFELGIPDLDSAIGGGVAQGEMIILAARPSHGKSAIALQIVHHATANGVPACFISEEMSALSLGKRAIQFASSTPEEHWAGQISNVRADIGNHFVQRAPAYVIESSGTSANCKAAIERCVREHKCGLAVIDYAQLLNSSKAKSEQERNSETSQILRRLASAENIVVVALVQLNRDIEKRSNFTPTAADIKGSGQFEQDADVIIAQVWPHKINSQLDPHNYQFFVLKNRNRAIMQTFVEVNFRPSRQMVVSKSVKQHKNYEQEFADYDPRF